MADRKSSQCTLVFQVLKKGKREAVRRLDTARRGFNFACLATGTLALVLESGSTSHNGFHKRNTPTQSKELSDGGTISN